MDKRTMQLKCFWNSDNQHQLFYLATCLQNIALIVLYIWLKCVELFFSLISRTLVISELWS